MTKTINKFFNKHEIKIYVILFFIFIFIPIIYYIYFFGINISDSHMRWAEYGTFFGGILGPILTSLVLFIMIITYRTQKQEFKELKELNRIENFETTFFSLIKYFDECYKNIELNTIDDLCLLENDKELNFPKGFYNTPKAYKIIIEQIQKKIKDPHDRNSASVYQSLKTIISYNSHRKIDEMVETFYLILKNIDASQISNKTLYVKLFLINLQPEELNIILLKTVACGENNWKSLCEKYGTFKKLNNIDLLKKFPKIQNKLKPSAFF